MRNRPTSLHVVLLLLFIISIQSLSLFGGGATSVDDDDAHVLEELLAIDDEEEAMWERKPSEAETLKRDQRVVIDLTNENAQKAVEVNDFLLLLGYAPWCQRCAKLMPSFVEAATKLREIGNPAVAAKLDTERHAKAAAVLGIRGLPALLLFSGGSSQRYTGGFTAEEIVVWTRKKTGTPVIRLSSMEAAKEFMTDHHIFVIGFFDKFEGYEYEEFVKAAAAENEIQFAKATDRNFVKVLFPALGSEKPFVGLVKSDPEMFEKFEDIFVESKILQFVDYNKFPLVTFLNDLNSVKVHTSPIKLQVFIFADPGDIEDLLPLLQDVARKFKTKIMFVYVDSTEDNLAKPILTMFGLESEKFAVTGFDNRVGSKFLLEADLTEKNLEEYCLQMLHGTLAPYYKSEPKPESNGMIEKVVGRTFDTDVLDAAENVFLEVYTPWCLDCKSTTKRVDKLAKHFSGSKNIKFARFDASANEHRELQMNNYPALLFYPSGDKANPIKISKNLSLKDLIALIEEKLKGILPGVDGTEKDEL